MKPPTLPSALSVLVACLLPATATPSAPVASAPYSLSVFTTSTSAYSQPDSIVQWGSSILIGFQNGVAKDGSDNKSSTIVQFSLDGKPQRMFSVPGHNDGLRIVGENSLWALQNEDANPNLVVIDLETGNQKMYSFAPTPHGGASDDMVVRLVAQRLDIGVEWFNHKFDIERKPLTCLVDQHGCDILDDDSQSF